MKRSIFAAMAATAALSLASAGHAQTASTAAAAPVDPVRMQLARQVLEASGGAKATEAQMRSMYAAIGKAMSQSMGASEAKLAEQMSRDMQEEVVSLIPSILDASAKAYAQNLSEKELRDMLAFYKTDSGQAVIRKLPVIMQQAMAEEMPLIVAMTPHIVQKTIERACDEAKCTSQDRQMIADAVARAMARPKS